jgi:hypothetical protein
MRIYEYAKEHGVESKVVVHALMEAGVIDKANAALSVEEDVIQEALGDTEQEPQAQEMQAYKFAKRYSLQTADVLHALQQAGVVETSNPSQKIEVGQALQICREADLFELKRHKALENGKVQDLKAGVVFMVGAPQAEVYSKAAEAYAAETGEDRNSVKVRNLAYKVVLRAFQDGLILPTDRSGNPYGRGAWDEDAKNHDEYVEATGTG